VATLGTATATATVDAQQWTWPERAQDLRELPADFPPERLRAVMTGFTSALGVRCSHCHVGEEGRPLATYDFVSDANPNKGRARAMLRLLGDVNRHLRDIDPSGQRVNMWCHTCHNGKPRPQTLSEAVGERYDAEGGEAAIAYFRELRGRHFGGPAYDFRPASVVEIAGGFLQAGDTVAARALYEVNSADYPDSWEAHEGMGDLSAAEGDAEAARRFYERALELEPGQPRVTAKLAGIGGR
jgi:tetratricopeptide (TPR) repeat protein